MAHLRGKARSRAVDTEVEISFPSIKAAGEGLLKSTISAAAAQSDVFPIRCAI